MRFLTVDDSDTIEAIGFELGPPPGGRDRPEGTLGVVFKSSPDTVYLYEQVDAAVFVRLAGADSIGKLFHELFRKTKYPFKKSQRPPTLKK